MTSIFGFTSKTDGVDDHLAAHVNALQLAADVLSGGIQGQMWNGKLEVSVAANDITVAIKTLAGADPSASDPVIFRVGNTLRILEAALSVTKTDGTNWFNSGAAELATQEIDYFAYIIWDTVPATDELDIGFARIPYARNTADFNATSTNPRYIATANGSALTANNECEVIGRFNAILSATAAFNWSIPATPIVINRPIYETRWLTWLPTYTGFSADPTLVASYQIDYNKMLWMIGPSATGTSNATTKTATLPITSASGTLNPFIAGRGINNGAEATCVFRNVAGTATLDAYQGPGTTAWTAAGSCLFCGEGFIRIG